jgi:hypothetical protein
MDSHNAECSPAKPGATVATHERSDQRRHRRTGGRMKQQQQENKKKQKNKKRKKKTDQPRRSCTPSSPKRQQSATTINHCMSTFISSIESVNDFVSASFVEGSFRLSG